MKKTSAILPAIAIYILATACTGDKGAEKETPPSSLVGTWELVSYISDSSGGKEWIDHPSYILYQKHLTPTHFTWFSYDKNNKQLLGMGGGTYTYDGKKYVESIEFFLPATSSILGQNINFTAEFEGGMWHHTGYVKNNEFDVETAEVVEVDSSRIEEKWRKVPGVAQNDSTLIGTWQLVSYRERKGAPEMSYPGFVNYMKLMTPSHFVWVQYNEEGDYISGIGSGTYEYLGQTYTENLAMMHPAGNILSDASIVFSAELSGNRWKHFAQRTTKKGQPVDSVYIDEIWTRYRKQ